MNIIAKVIEVKLTNVHKNELFYIMQTPVQAACTHMNTQIDVWK